VSPRPRKKEVRTIITAIPTSPNSRALTYATEALCISAEGPSRVMSGSIKKARSTATASVAGTTA
jgi:hypothetical protein